MANTYTYNVHSGTPIESFPFGGEWETFGIGYAANDVNDVLSCGSIDSNTLLGTEIYSIGGIQSGEGFAGSGASPPQVFVILAPGEFQNTFINVTFQLEGACNSPYTFNSNTANLFTNTPSYAPESACWVWSVPNIGLMFANGQNTVVTFNAEPPAPPPVDMVLYGLGPTPNEIDLAWFDESGTDLAVYFNLSRDGGFIEQFPNTVLSFADLGLTPATTYSYSIVGVDANNNPIYTPATTIIGTPDSGGTTLDVSFLSAINGQQFFDASGNVAIGGSVYTYFAGSTVPCTTYTDVTGATSNPNPLEINVGGYLNTEIWVQSGTNTHIQVYDANNVLLQDVDNIPGVPYVPTLTQVNVIDSIFSVDTANAASANAANWNYLIANAAYGYANTLNVAIGDLVTAVADLGGSTITFEQGGSVINVGNTINFLNTAFANIAVTSIAGGVDVQIFANAATSGPSTNSSFTVGGFIVQWCYYSHTEAGEAGPFTDDFPTSFPTACLAIQATTAGGPGAVSLAISAITRTAFTWYTGFGGADTTGQYVLAIGH